MEYLPLRLAKAVQQPWCLELIKFRCCVQQREAPFASLCAVLDELVRIWAEVKQNCFTVPAAEGTPHVNFSRLTDSH